MTIDREGLNVGDRMLAAPFLIAVGLVGLAYVGGVRDSWPLQRALLGAAAVLAVWNAVVLLRARRAGRSLAVEISVRRQHYLQACAQGSVLLYWGWYWHPVYGAVPLLVAQLLFAYAFDMLLAWSRRDTYTLGFGPFPVVFSVNLFLWFKADWFYFQFLLLALGFSAKELIRWNKQGRLAHIFNPSSFPLAVVSVALILTGKSDLTWGQEIASTQFYPPQMYLMLFLVGLPGQYFFGVTSMTMSAVVTTYVFGLLYFAVTGVYFFYDSYIPIAVLLGMHLLFTDPSTSPRTELGRLVFGALYGLSTLALYALLLLAGVPPFYDKLLQVPLLNLSLKALDHLATTWPLQALAPEKVGRSLTSRQRHLAYMSVWVVVFAVMTAFEGVGDWHRGQWLPFWQQACRAERRNACAYFEGLVSGFCERGSGWACNELGIVEAHRESEISDAVESTIRGCDLGFPPACANADVLSNSDRPRRSLRSEPPAAIDYPIVLRGSKGPLTARTPEALAALACREGWTSACASTAQSQ
ncbi:MAG: hypothetical protein DMF89_18280 [Acidobacteria bacterium]|nr:MAG: hypothetical protein DMF89_18280 [Acidobacteriota bacterium]